jgi:hypothetical protein
MKSMLDRRAWIVSSLIVLIAAGAYIIWITRPRARYEARSLSAAQRPPKQNPNIGTRTLHVEGCDKDFIVKIGELVEPRAVPGASLEQFRNLYGKETKREDKQNFTWSRDPFSLTQANYGTENLASFVNISVNRGHVVQTLDDVELGLDSMGTLFRKMRDRKIEVHERVHGLDGNWTLTVSFFSFCERKYRSEYSVTIPGSPETDNAVMPSKNGPQDSGKLWRSGAFMNKVIYDYSLVPSGGKDDSVEGQPSGHN